MTFHTCDKEVELAEMHADIKYIKKAIAGNGEKGLLKEVSENREFRIASKAKGSIIKFMVGGGWLTTIVLLVVQIIR